VSLRSGSPKGVKGFILQAGTGSWLGSCTSIRNSGELAVTSLCLRMGTSKITAGQLRALLQGAYNSRPRLPCAFGAPAAQHNPTTPRQRKSSDQQGQRAAGRAGKKPGSCEPPVLPASPRSPASLRAGRDERPLSLQCLGNGGLQSRATPWQSLWISQIKGKGKEVAPVGTPSSGTRTSGKQAQQPLFPRESSHSPANATPAARRGLGGPRAR